LRCFSSGLVLALASLGCSSAGDEPGSCSAHGEGALEVRRDSIVGGADDADYLALTPDEREAIVAISLGSADVPHCSGALLGGSLVLTAWHCVGDASPAALLVGSPRAGYWPVAAVHANEQADLALLFLVDALPGRPLRLAPAVGDTWRGRRVALAGYGLNDRSAAQRLLFATTEVTAIDATYLTTSGFGAAGACLGDSGGPLLGRADDGSVVVLGILSDGSVSCELEDRYRRVDSVAGWLRESVAALPEDESCGALTLAGRCFDGRAVWCDQDGVRRSQSCTPAKPCGWDSALEGYRCVNPELDCAGADAFGACLGGGVRRCAAELDEYLPCSACQRCGFDPRTGNAGCYPN
jgi:hypothetical protein